MILRAAIVFLLVLNIGIAAWWISGGNVATTPAAAPMPAGVPSLRLVAENVVASPSIAAAATTPTPVATAGGSGTGSEVMSRIAAPMVGGMVSSTVLTLAVIPALYALVKRRELG